MSERTGDGTGDDRLARRVAADETILWRSLIRLQRVGELHDLDADDERVGDTRLVRAMREIGRRSGFELDTAALPPGTVDRDTLSDLAAIASSAHVNLRSVRVDGDRYGTTPLLAFRGHAGDSQRLDDPVVLIPAEGRHPTRCWDPDTGELTATAETELLPVAFEFYPPLRSDGGLSFLQVARFSFRGSRPEVLTILAVALGAGLLGLLTPIITRQVFGTIVPERERSLLWAAGGALVLAAFVVWAFTVVQGFAVTRVSLRAQQRLQPAVWARVLSLPASFFRNYASGELATRVLSADQLRMSVSTTNVGVALAAVFSLVNLGLMYYYDVALGIAGTIVIAGSLAATAWFGRRLIAQTNDIVVQLRANNAHISDVLEGLSAIRTAAAEMRFFGLHAELVRRKTVLQARQQRTQIGLQTFYAGVTTVAPALFITAVAVWQWDGSAGISEVSAPVYVAFTTAFSTVLASMLALSALIQPLAVAPPTVDAMRPIFEATPEYDETKRAAGAIAGRVELRAVSFRYSPRSRWVARDLSFVAEPGEFVALVGHSGAGKSTMLRLLLGFEQPEQGAVIYDSYNLREVDLSSIRSQLGVVLQDSRPMAGSILDNVIGARPVGPDAAWRALDAAGLGDEVRAMPMNIHTQVTADGSTMSGGQIQRLMIARALVVEPRILLLDEATSHLDDATQQTVSDGIAGLGITRVVIAHRLSTIRAADKICVLAGGRVVEQGSYDELMSLGGEFAALARRQTV